MNERDCWKGRNAGLHGAFALLVLLSCCGAVAEDASDSVYVTWSGAEPDKGACAWYIKRVIDREARFTVVAPGAALPNGVAFDVPQSPYRRTHNASAFETLLRQHPTDDPVIRRLAQLTHDIEINLWRPKVYAETGALEGRVREIEAGFEAGDIPLDCFIEFFDGVYEWIAQGHTDEASLPIPPACQGGR